MNLAVFLAVTLDSRLVHVLALPPAWSALVEQPWNKITVFFTAEMLIHFAGTVFLIVLFGVRLERIAPWWFWPSSLPP